VKNVEGSIYTTEFRQYDPRVGRWLSMDPLMAKYPHQSPYVAFNNNPIYFADPTGLEGDPPDKVIDLQDGDGNDVQDQTFNTTVNNVDKVKVDELINTMITSPDKLLDNDWADYEHNDQDGDGKFSEGDNVDIDIWGPDNGSVNVAKIVNEDGKVELYFQTLEGHPEAGKIRFQLTYEENADGTYNVQFEIRNISRANLGINGEVPFAESYSRYAQKDQWKEVMANFADFTDAKSFKSQMKIITYEWDWANQKTGELESIVTEDVTQEVQEKRDP